MVYVMIFIYSAMFLVGGIFAEWLKEVPDYASCFIPLLHMVLV